MASKPKTKNSPVVQPVHNLDPLFTWIDTSPNDFTNRPHRSFTLNLPDLRIQLYTAFGDCSKWMASFYPEIAATTMLRARKLEAAQNEAVTIARRAADRLAAQLKTLSSPTGGFTEEFLINLKP